MISEALNDIHPKRGVGYKAVLNYIEFTYPVKENFSRYVKQALRAGLDSGIIQIAPIAKYRLSVKGRKLLEAPQKSKKKTTTKTPKTNVKKPKPSSTTDSQKTKRKSRSKSPSKEKKKPKIKPEKKKSPPEKKAKKSPPEKKTTKKKSDSSQSTDTVKEKSKFDYIWQYRENNGTWGDYDLKPSDVLEEVYQAYLENREGTDIRTEEWSMGI